MLHRLVVSIHTVDGMRLTGAKEVRALFGCIKAFLKKWGYFSEIGI
jgi:hypothetical protein